MPSIPIRIWIIFLVIALAIGAITYLASEYLEAATSLLPGGEDGG